MHKRHIWSNVFWCPNSYIFSVLVCYSHILG
jgi:hypothetical protein